MPEAARQSLPEGARHDDLVSGCCHVHVVRAAREPRHRPAPVGRRDGRDVRIRRRVAERAAPVSVVPGRGDDQRARRNRLVDGELDREVADVRAEAQVDHAAPRPGRCQQASGDLARVESSAVALRRVPGAEHRARVDADQADAVHRSGDHRRHRGAVLTAERHGLLRVQGLGVRAAEELGMVDVEAGVDDRHGHAGAGRGEPGDSDLRKPPFVRLQRIGRVGRRGDTVRALLLREDDRVARTQRGHGACRETRLEAPEPEAGVHLAPAGAGQRGALDARSGLRQLHHRRGAARMRGRGDGRREHEAREAENREEAW